jgi:hypothetical protein
MSAAMTSRLFAICFGAGEPRDLARFWAGVLGRETADDPDDGVTLPPNDDTGPRLRFLPNDEPKVGQNRLHFDLAPPAGGDRQAEVDRLISLGQRGPAPRPVTWR